MLVPDECAVLKCGGFAHLQTVRDVALLNRCRPEICQKAYWSYAVAKRVAVTCILMNLPYGSTWTETVFEVTSLHMLKRASPTTQSAAPEFRSQESEARIRKRATKQLVLYLRYPGVSGLILNL